MSKVRFLLLMLLLFLGSVLISLFWFFPEDALRERLTQELNRNNQVKISIEALNLQFPAGLKLDLLVDTGQPQLRPVQIQQLELSPVWTSVFTGSPAVKFSGELAEGEVSGSINNNEDLELTLARVNLGSFPATTNPYQVTGILGAKLSGSRVLSRGGQQLNFTAEIGDATIAGLGSMGLPDRLALGQFLAEGEQRGQQMTLKTMTLQGGVASLAGDGSLSLGATPQQSRINLRLQLTPQRDFPPMLKDLISLSGAKPQGDGRYDFRLIGNLANPQLR